MHRLIETKLLKEIKDYLVFLPKEFLNEPLIAKVKDVSSIDNIPIITWSGEDIPYELEDCDQEFYCHRLIEHVKDFLEGCECGDCIRPAIKEAVDDLKREIQAEKEPSEDSD